MFFIGFSAAMTAAFALKKTSIDKSSDTIEINKPKIKGNNSSIDNVVSKTELPDNKRKLFKNRRKKNES